MPIIETKKLICKLGSAPAVDSLDITNEAGEAFALLDPNGAWKSTSVKMLSLFLFIYCNKRQSSHI